jgi:hypothetical protein
MNARELKKLEQKCTEFTQKRDARLLKSLQEKLDKAHKIAESFPLSKIRKSNCSRKQNPEVCQQLCKCNCVYGLALLIKSGYSISISEKIKYIITKGEPMEENKKAIVVSSEYVEAKKLTENIMSNIQLARDAVWEIGKSLIAMRDGKLYKELGYSNFEEYVTNEIGFSRKQGYQYISIVENLPEEFCNPGVTKQISMSNLYVLSRLSESDRETIMQENDVSDISKRNLEKKVAEMEAKQKQAESRISELESENQDKQDKIISLERQNEELENQPRDTVFENDPETLEEIERLKAQNETLAEQKTELELKIWDYENQEQSVSDAEEKRFAEFTSNMNQQLVEERQRLKKESQEEIQRANLQRDNAFLEVEKLKKQLAEQKEDAPEMKQFKVRIATLCDSIEQLVKFLCENPDTAFLDKSETVVKSAESSLSEIRKQVQA